MNIMFTLYCGVSRIWTRSLRSSVSTPQYLHLLFFCFDWWVSAAPGGNFAVFIHCCTFMLYLYVVVLLRDESHSNLLLFAFIGQEFRLYSMYVVFLSFLL